MTIISFFDGNDLLKQITLSNNNEKLLPYICKWVSNLLSFMTEWSQGIPTILDLKYLTVITLSIGTDRPLQTEQTQMKCHRMQHLIRVYIVCHTYSNILDTSTGCRMDYFKVVVVMVIIQTHKSVNKWRIRIFRPTDMDPRIKDVIRRPRIVSITW